MIYPDESDDFHRWSMRQSISITFDSTVLQTWTLAAERGDYQVKSTLSAGRMFSLNSVKLQRFGGVVGW